MRLSTSVSFVLWGILFSSRHRTRKKGKCTLSGFANLALHVNRPVSKSAVLFEQSHALVEGVLECNQMPNPTGQAPPKSNALPRIFTGNHWAPLGVTGGQWALRESLAWSHDDFFVCRIPHKKTQRPIPIKCAVSRDTSTGTSVS